MADNDYKAPRTATQVVRDSSNTRGPNWAYTEPGTIEDSYENYKPALQNYEKRDDVEDLAVRRERAISSQFNQGNPGGVPASNEDKGQGPNPLNNDGTANPDNNPATGSGA